jgi:hypothetical protein
MQASVMVYRGYVAKGTRLNEGNGTATAGLETEAQMNGKHPHWHLPYGTAPDRAEEPGPVNPDQAQQALLRTRLVVGVGPRGLRPGQPTPLSK